MVVTQQTDIADTWSVKGRRPHSYFDTFSPRGYAIA